MDLRRRDFLMQLALAAGGTLSSGCTRFLASRGPGPTPPASRSVLSRDERETVAIAAELVIPTTDTPGARAAGVPEFIDMMLADWFDDGERASFRAGLARLDALARERSGASFAAAGEAVQTALLGELEGEALAVPPGSGPSLMRNMSPQRAVPPVFFTALKELVLVGYYTSEIGASQELAYEPISDAYRGCIPLARVGRAWAE